MSKEDLKQEAPENCIICLTGNKIDLEDKREVTAEEMVVFAQKYGLNMVFETSAKTNYGMDDMIYELAMEIDVQKENFDALFTKRSSSVALNNQLHNSIKDKNSGSQVTGDMTK